MSDPTKPSPVAAAKAVREAKLAAALRANLRRRKAQGREREAAQATGLAADADRTADLSGEAASGTPTRE